MSRASKAYSNSLQDKVKRVIQANHQLRDELKAKDQEIAELKARLHKPLKCPNDCEYKTKPKWTYDNKLICEECIRDKADHYTPKENT